jgi:hypothetical protein
MQNYVQNVPRFRTQLSHVAGTGHVNTWNHATVAASAHLPCASLILKTPSKITLVRRNGWTDNTRYQDRQCTYKHNTEARSRNHCYRGRAISIKYYERVPVALIIQRAKRMRRVILSPVACLTVTYFSTLFHNRHNFRGGGGGEFFNKKYGFLFYIKIFYETLHIKRI